MRPEAPLLVGLDVGTTSTIGVLAAPEGRLLATASRPVRLASPAPGWAEEDPDEWWANACSILHELVAAADSAGRPIGAVGVTGMVPALILLDEAGRPLRPSIQQSDGRTAREVAELAAAVDAGQFLRRTGCGINQQLVAPKLRWLARHEPEVMRRATTILGSYDYLNLQLTGSAGVEQNWALESGLMELETRRFAADLVALGGIAPALLPPIRSSHAIVGGVTAAAARATGLPAGLPVVGGCADHVASAFVAGIVKPGDVLLKFGGAGDILTVAGAPIADPRLFLDFHIVPGLFLPNGCMASSGAVLNWIARELGGPAACDGRSPHQLLDAQAAELQPGADGLVLLPYFLGEKTPIHDPLARGTFVGLGLHHRLPHLWRAALEGIVFGFRHHVDVLDEVGLTPRRFVASDGGASSELWMQIAADVLQAPIELLDGHPGSALGAAFVAGHSIGALTDWGDIARFTRRSRVVQPQAATKATYDRLYEVYRQTYEALKTVYPGLASTPAS